MRRSGFPMIVTLAILVFFYLPMVVMGIYSFNASRFGGTWEGFSTRWYVALLHDRNVWNAVENTFIVALSCTGVSVVLGTLAAFALHLYKSRLQFIHYMMIYAPLVVPEILMGMSLLLLFVAVGAKLGLWTIFLAHVTFCISYVAMVVLGRLQDFDFSVYEAARDLGASRWAAFHKVLLPLLAPGIVAGGLLAFTLSLDDFVITFFVSGPGSTTLPVYIYSLMKHGSPTVINALSVILFLLTLVIVVASQLITGEDKK